MASKLVASPPQVPGEDHLPPFTMDASVVKTLSGKSVFLTGATGFVGKVILEKLIRSVPDIKRVYLLVRARKGQPVQQRLYDEIITSKIFDHMRTVRPDFNEWANKTFYAIAGELTQNELGISKEDQELLKNDLDSVIHCAAVVDFNERLDRAIELNTLGSLRMLDLAKQCKKVGSFVHVSTCYVNSNKPTNSFIEEKLYPLGFEPEELIKKVLDMPSSELDTIASSGILRDWPNTYTMTKAMTEHLLVKNRGDMPLVIVRPSIVGSAYCDPLAGWVDVISAAGAVFIAVGMGVVKFLPGSPRNIGDIIPVDYVADSIIASIAVIHEKKNKWFICQAASSSENPMYWEVPMHVVMDYFVKYPPPRSVGPASFRFSSSSQMQQLRFFLNYSVPSSLLNTMSLISSSMYEKKAQMFTKLIWQVRVLSEAFTYFTQNSWIYDNRNVRSIYSMLVPEERELFNLDLSSLCWKRYSELFAYGLTCYTNKSCHLIPPKQRDLRHIDVTTDILSPFRDSLTHKFAPDFNAISNIVAERETKCKFPKSRPVGEMVSAVLNSDEVQTAMKNEIAYLNTHGNGKKKLKEPAATIVENRIDGIVKSMFGDVSSTTISSMAWLLRKIWRRVYSGVHVARDNLAEVIDASKTGPIIYLPNHRSYVDFLLMSYVAFLFQLPLPNIAAGEDFLGILAVRQIFRKSGAFFIRRTFAQDKLYTAILNKYVELMLLDGQSLEFYVEGTRSRTGKMLQPKVGMLSLVLNAVTRGVLKDATIVPVTFNYEKTMEGNLYANELSGNHKVKESLSALFRARSVVNSNFGATTVVFGKPVSVRKWVDDYHSTMSTSSAKRDRMEKVINYQKELKLAASSMVPSYVTRPADATRLPSVVAQKALTAPVKAQSFDLAKNPAHGKYMVRELAFNVLNEIAVNCECMPIHIVSALLLQYRHGISRTQLLGKVEWLCNAIELRGGYVFGIEMETRDKIVDKAIAFLGDVVRRPNLNVYEPAISTRAEYTNMLVLGLYKNRIVHYFFHEALWCISIYALSSARSSGATAATQMAGSKAPTFSALRSAVVSGVKAKENDNGAEVSAVTEEMALREVEFLHSLLHTEFVFRGDPDEPVDHRGVLEVMIENGVLTRCVNDPSKIQVSPSGESHFSFLCSLLWPFVDSFYTAAMTLYTLLPSAAMEKDALVAQSQWLGTTLYHESMLCFFESCSKETLSNAFSVFKSFGVIRSQPVKGSSRPTPPDGSLVTAPEKIELTEEFQDETVLENLVDHISLLRKQPAISRSLSRKALIAEIPILARLNNSSFTSKL